MARKAKEDWEKTFLGRVISERETETKRWKEEKKRQDKIDEKRTAMAKELNMLLEAANANIKYMADKNKLFNEFLWRLMGAEEAIKTNPNVHCRCCLIYQIISGSGDSDGLILYLRFCEGIPSFCFSYARVSWGKVNETLTNFQPSTERDRRFFERLTKSRCSQIATVLKIFSSPESTIKFFMDSGFKYLLKNIPCS